MDKLEKLEREKREARRSAELAERIFKNADGTLKTDKVVYDAQIGAGTDPLRRSGEKEETVYDAERAEEAAMGGGDYLPGRRPEGAEEGREVAEYLPQGLVPVGMIGPIITEMMRPVMESIGKMLENNTAALEQLSAAQSVQNDRLEALEKQIRLQTPVSAKEAGYLNAAIRKRARELLDKRDVTEEKAVKQLGNIIRRAVLQRYGTGSMREIPKHEYQVALQQIGIWNDMLEIRDVVKEARKRAESSENAQ